LVLGVAEASLPIAPSFIMADCRHQTIMRPLSNFQLSAWMHKGARLCRDNDGVTGRLKIGLLRDSVFPKVQALGVVRFGVRTAAGGRIAGTVGFILNQQACQFYRDLVLPDSWAATFRQAAWSPDKPCGRN